MKLGIYRHYKGNLYQVFGLARCSESPEQQMVVYQALYGEYGFWLRPLEMWIEEVEYQGQRVARFTLISGRSIE